MGRPAARTVNRLPERLARLITGLFLYGFTMAMMVESTLGLDPWDVFHEGLTHHVPLTFGQVVDRSRRAGAAALDPVAADARLGTILNVLIIGLAADFGIAVIDQPDNLWWRGLLLVGGIVGNGFAGALYIGAQLGPGPRDGLWLGLVRRTGRSVRFWRTVDRGDRPGRRIPARRHRRIGHRAVRAHDRPHRAVLPAHGGPATAYRQIAGTRARLIPQGIRSRTAGRRDRWTSGGPT